MLNLIRFSIRTKQNAGGGPVTAHGLSLINNKFLITADSSKPLLHIWPVNSQEQIQGVRFVVPGKVTALTVSPEGNYCVAAVSETIFIWQICSGKMLAILSRHYQSVTSLKFTDDGSHFISAGHDGMLLVWKLSSVIAFGSNSSDATPLYSFSDHALPISDIYLGKGGMRAFLISVSLDRTCKLYDLSSGTLLLNLVFPEALTAVTLDHLDTKVYVGTADANIFEFSLQSPPRMKEYHVSNEALTATKQRFIGHTGAVTTLSISLDGEILLSGSNDENVRVWHIPSRQLIRTLPHKGSITNAFFLLTPKHMFDQEAKLHLTTNNFKRMMDQQGNEDNDVIEILVKDSLEVDDVTGGEVVIVNGSGTKEIISTNGCGTVDDAQELSVLKAEVKRLKKINKDLFQYATTNMLRENK